jgi:hypothetical protein
MKAKADDEKEGLEGISCSICTHGVEVMVQSDSGSVAQSIVIVPWKRPRGGPVNFP